MPELPEVETYKRYLNRTALQQTVTEVSVENTKVLDGVSRARLIDTLTGATLEESSRHGKHLFVRLDDGPWLMLHFGMTGLLKYFKNDPGLSHVRLLLSFDNGYHLAYLNQRLFGRVSLTGSPGAFVKEHDLGPDARAISEDRFVSLLASHRGGVKSVLMNQSAIAGLGNIYVDEVLYHAGIHPRTSLQRIDNDTLHALFSVMKRILRVAIDHQADPADMPRDYLISHRDEGAPCPRCGGSVSHTRINGRSTYFCPACQKQRS